MLAKVKNASGRIGIFFYGIAPKVCSGRNRGAKKSGRGAHFDRREWAQVDSKLSHFFGPRSTGDQREKVSATST